MTIESSFLNRIILSSLLGVVGCEAGTIEHQRPIPEADRSPLVASWGLRAAEDFSLIDPRRPERRYPNPGEYDRLEVKVHQDGLICGRFFEADQKALESCGGPSEGIPYFAVPRVTNGTLRLSVLDTIGNEILRSRPLTGTCIESDGSCRVCVDESGRIGELECPAPEPGPLAEGRNEAPPAPEVECFIRGAEAFVDFVNAELQRIAMPEWTVDPRALAVPPEGDGPIAPPEGIVDIRIGVPRAMHAVRNVCETYGAGRIRLRENDTYLRSEGRVRCGFLASDGMTTACRVDDAECSGEGRVTFEHGILAAYNAWTGGDGRGFGWEEEHANGRPCSLENPDCAREETEGPECSGSPLVVGDPGVGIELVPTGEGPQFDVLAWGRRVQTGWVRRGAFLVLDRDGDGTIGDGRELFGEATPRFDGRLADDGFDALRQFDAERMGGNGDGRLDERDAIYPHLRLWRDADLDGRSAPDELRSLSTDGIAWIGLSGSTPEGGAREDAGQWIGLEGVGGGASGPRAIYDVWFSFRGGATGSGGEEQPYCRARTDEATHPRR